MYVVLKISDGCRMYLDRRAVRENKSREQVARELLEQRAAAAADNAAAFGTAREHSPVPAIDTVSHEQNIESARRRLTRRQFAVFEVATMMAAELERTPTYYEVADRCGTTYVQRIRDMIYRIRGRGVQVAVGTEQGFRRTGGTPIKVQREGDRP